MTKSTGSNSIGNLSLTTEALRYAALTAAAAGYHVFPLAPLSKKPAFRRWQGAATRSSNLIRDYWTQSPFNIGIACEPSDLYVVDLDDAHGQQPPPGLEGVNHGRDVLARLAVAAGAPYPSNTFTVATPTGGQHLYFEMPTEHGVWRNTVGHLGWRIDTRGTGGYVVAAGSVCREGAYVVTNDAPIAPLPRWLQSMLTARPEEVSGIASPLPQNAPVLRIDAYLARVAHNVTQAKPGRRHDILIRAAYTLGRLVGGGEVSRQRASAILSDAASVHIGVDNWTHAEAQRTIHDGLAAGAEHPRALSD